MIHAIAASCGQGVHVSCAKYATESWSGGGAILGAVILAIIVGLFLLSRNSPRRARRRTDN